MFYLVKTPEDRFSCDEAQIQSSKSVQEKLLQRSQQSSKNQYIQVNCPVTGEMQMKHQFTKKGIVTHQSTTT